MDHYMFIITLKIQTWS